MPPQNTPNYLILQNIHLCGRRSLHPKRRHIQYIKKEMRKCKLTPEFSRRQVYAGRTNGGTDLDLLVIIAQNQSPFSQPTP